MKKEKLQQLAHLAAGLITLIHGLDTFEAGQLSSAGAYLSLALMFMIVAGLHKRITRQLMQGDVAFFLLEATTILYSGWHYKEAGHLILFTLMVIAAAFFLVFAFLSIRSDERPRRRSRHHRRRSSSSGNTA